MPYFVVFLKFCPSNSQRKYRDCKPTWHSTSVMVVTWKCYDPANKPPPPPPPPPPNASIHKGGGIIAGFYSITTRGEWDSYITIYLFFLSIIISIIQNAVLKKLVYCVHNTDRLLQNLPSISSHTPARLKLIVAAAIIQN